MNEHVADDMHACMVHDFNDYENLVICRSLVAQLSGRPQPQGMDYDSYAEDLYTACGYHDFCLAGAPAVALPEEEGCASALPGRGFLFYSYARYDHLLSVS